MRDFSNIYSLDQANKWMKTLNSIYGVNLDIEDIHRLFQKFGVWFKTKNIDGKDIKFYKKSDIVDLIGSGRIKKEIDNIIKGEKAFSGLRKLPVSYSKPPEEGPEKVVKRGGRYIILPNKPIETTDDDSDVEYRNHENNMKDYSDYLINNVYQFEGKQNKKRIFVTETQLKKFLNDMI